jgi:hypothetical protein
VASIEEVLHPWDEPDLVMLYDLFDMLLNLVCQYFIEDFCTMFVKEIGCTYLCCILGLVFGMSVTLAS